MKPLLIISVVALVLAQATADKKVVCYWATWSADRDGGNGDGKFDLSHLDPKLCTHLIYSFVRISEVTGEVECFDATCDDPQSVKNIARVTELRKQNPELKTMVAIGGYAEGSSKYSRAAADPSRRRKFVESAVAFVKKHGLDGFDVDWEYPARRGGSPADKENYVLLLKELRERFDQEGLILSAAVAASAWAADQSYDIPKISKYLDFINVMAYDFHGGWESQAGVHAAIYGASSESGGNEKLNVNGAIEYWLSHGAPAEKLILGVPFYGKSFTLSNPQPNGVGVPASKGLPGPYTGEGGTLGYNEICEKLMNDNWQMVFDEERRVPCAFGGNQWVSYDDTQSLKEKADFIKEHNLGGAMIWSIDMDDFRGKCGEKFPLLQTVNSELRNGVSSAPGISHPKGEAQKSQPHNQPSHQSPQSEPNNSQQYQPDYSQQQYEPIYAQPEYPQQQANNGQICQAHDQYVRDPKNCTMFYHCQSYDGGFIAHHKICPETLLFNESNKVCDWPENVQCIVGN